MCLKATWQQNNMAAVKCEEDDDARGIYTTPKRLNYRVGLKRDLKIMRLKLIDSRHTGESHWNGTTRRSSAPKPESWRGLLNRWDEDCERAEERAKKRNAALPYIYRKFATFSILRPVYI